MVQDKREKFGMTILRKKFTFIENLRYSSYQALLESDKNKSTQKEGNLYAKRN